MARLKLAPPLGAETIAATPQLPVSRTGVASERPAGRLSTKAMSSTGVGFVLLTVNVRVLILPGPTVLGLNSLEKPKGSALEVVANALAENTSIASLTQRMNEFLADT